MYYWSFFSYCITFYVLIMKCLTSTNLSSFHQAKCILKTCGFLAIVLNLKKPWWISFLFYIPKMSKCIYFFSVGLMFTFFKLLLCVCNVLDICVTTNLLSSIQRYSLQRYYSLQHFMFCIRKVIYISAT